GMTGTAKTEAAELMDIYNLEVVQIPTNLPINRVDHDDEVYRTSREKNDAIVKLIAECRSRLQPVLVGTVSIEKSEQLSNLLKKANVPHQVLNARYHEQEATIIAEAGRPGAVTIATNMAGRGTDIKLGGNIDVRLAAALQGVEDPAKRKQIEEQVRAEVMAAQEQVKAAGGLYVIGTERHESRRIDNQLRGRSGRQADPGASKFFLSLEDDLMRIFGSERLDNILQRLGLQEGEAIIHPWVNKALERAQQKVEARNSEIRKHLLRYDDVMNNQRKVVYEQRRELMGQDDISELTTEMREDVLDMVIRAAIPEEAYPDQWNVEALHEECLRLFALDLPIATWAEEDGIAELELRQRILDTIHARMAEKEERYGAPMMRAAEKSVLLRLLDQAWKDHLLGLDHLRQGINLRAYGQRDPLNEYKSEAFVMFQDMMARVRETTTSALCHLELYQESPEDIEARAFKNASVAADKLRLHHGHEVETSEDNSAKASGALEQTLATSTINRNALCPCGSGRRFKHCHGKV
ncbi:MAG: SEC-C metal-binding domain-containing protein, partial [Holosporales bacterium]